MGTASVAMSFGLDKAPENADPGGERCATYYVSTSLDGVDGPISCTAWTASRPQQPCQMLLRNCCVTEHVYGPFLYGGPRNAQLQQCATALTATFRFRLSARIGAHDNPLFLLSRSESPGPALAKHRQPPRTCFGQGLKPRAFIALPRPWRLAQYSAQGSTVRNDKYSRAVATVHSAPLLIVESCSHAIGIETPSPGRARAEKAAAVVAPWPLRR